MTTRNDNTPSRREFLKRTGQISAAAAIGSAMAPRVHAAEDNTIRVALVGCGGRGTGAAANALSTEGPAKLVAMADVFESRLASSHKNLVDRFAEKIDVPAERQFVGFDGYKKAIECVGPGGLVLLATPPGFRPLHVEYAVDRGVHVFMEKSFGVDAPGIRRVLAAGEKAKEKNLKIASGLMSRHYPPLVEAVQKIHDGAIGDVLTCWAFRMHGPVGFRPKTEGVSELMHQVRNYSCFTWLNGSFLLDWLIHNLDVCCWVKYAWPVSAQGMGGREVRNRPDQLFDHYFVEYIFPDGTRLAAQGRHMAGCYGFFGDKIQGTKGVAVLGEGITKPQIFEGPAEDRSRLVWEQGGAYGTAYQIEHDKLFKAIREDLPYNEAERSAKAAMVGILGRFAIESGKEVSWDDAIASDLVLAPGLDQMTLDSEAPVQPNDDGAYPIPVPGLSKVF